MGILKAVGTLRTGRRETVRVAAVMGIAGPAVFTCAWIIGSLRQAGYRPADIQLSGLAAPDATDPWIMITGFLVLGGCAVVFGEAAHEALGGSGNAGLGPRCVTAAGVLTIAAALLRRDHMLLIPGPVSWHNHAHDVVSAAIYVDLVLGQFLLARRFGADPAWLRWRPWLLVSGTTTAALLAVFISDTSAPGAGVLQRVVVTIPLAVMASVAARLSYADGWRRSSAASRSSS